MPLRALVVVVSVLVGLGLVLSGTAQAAPVLSPATDGAVAGLPLEVSGSCDPPAPSSRSTSQGVQVGLLRDGQIVVQAPAVPDGGPGRFTATIQLPQDLAPGAATLASSCGGRAPFAVLAAPTLVLTPARVAAGDQVSTAGTCPAGTGDRTDVMLTGRRLAGTGIDTSSGRFGPTPITVPAGSRPGRQDVTTSCGGATTLVVLTQPAPTTLPSPTTTAAPPAAVTVPDLTGMTADQAAVVLGGVQGGGLVLGEVSGSGPRITGQSPSPGSRVQVGTSVAVVLTASGVTHAFPVLLVVLPAAALLVLLVAAAVQLRVRRLRRERRWVDEEVDVGIDGRGPPVELPAVPDGAVPALEIRLVLHREPNHGDLQEAGHGRD